MAVRPQVVMASVGGASRMRRPLHPFSVKAPPFAIAPFFIAPVLAGETMKNLLMQARVVTDPIKNRLIGWSQEYYFFYVKLRDLNERETLTGMLINPTTDVTGIDAPSAAVATFHPAGTGQIDFVQMCLDRVVECYFRDEGDAASAYTFSDGTTTWYSAQLNQNNPLDSAFTSTQFDAQVPAVTVGVDDAFNAVEVDSMMRQWEMLKNNGLTEMSYEDYLATFGVKLKGEEAHKPRLIRYVKEWSYPTNIVEPTTGVPTSAVSWTIKETANKDQSFREPGFLFGVTVTRPKVYLRNYAGTLTSSMNLVQRWLPAMWQKEPEARRMFLADNTGPLQVTTEGYHVDVGDLFSYGEQFVNYALSSTTDNMLPLPIATLANKRYVTDFDWVQEMFVGTEPVSLVQQDGIVSLHIAGTISDLSPRGGPKVEIET